MTDSLEELYKEVTEEDVDKLLSVIQHSFALKEQDKLNVLSKEEKYILAHLYLTTDAALDKNMFGFIPAKIKHFILFTIISSYLHDPNHTLIPYSYMEYEEQGHALCTVEFVINMYLDGSCQQHYPITTLCYTLQKIDTEHPELAYFNIKDIQDVPEECLISKDYDESFTVLLLNCFTKTYVQLDTTNNKDAHQYNEYMQTLLQSDEHTCTYTSENSTLKHICEKYALALTQRKLYVGTLQMYHNGIIAVDQYTQEYKKYNSYTAARLQPELILYAAYLLVDEFTTTFESMIPTEDTEH